MKLSQYRLEFKKKHPKTWEKIDKRWDIKIIGSVMDFTMSIGNHINPRLDKLRKKNEYLYSAPDIEGDLWKLLAKVRRITLLEKSHKKIKPTPTVKKIV